MFCHSQEFQARLPALHSQLLAANIISDAYAVEYFTTAYIYSTAYPTTLRIWDLFLLEGAGVLFEVGWAVMKCVSEPVGQACVQTPDTALQVLRQTVPQLTGRMIFQVCASLLLFCFEWFATHPLLEFPRLQRIIEQMK